MKNFDQEQFNKMVREAFQNAKVEHQQEQEEARLKAEREERRFKALLEDITEQLPKKIAEAIKFSSKTPFHTIGWMPGNYIDFSDSEVAFNSLLVKDRLSHLTENGKRLFTILEDAGLTVYPEEGDDELYDNLDEDEDCHDYITGYYNIILDVGRSPAAQQSTEPNNNDSNDRSPGVWRGTQFDPEGNWKISHPAQD